MENKYIYLDNGATTKMKKEVIEAMLPYFDEYFGNASSLYELARLSREAIEKARHDVASVLEVLDKEIYFTSGGTESDNWALKGVAKANLKKGNHIITTSIEHPAINNTLKKLEKEGFEVTYLSVDEKGYISLEELKNSIKAETILISVIAANNEIGTIQKLEQISKIAREAKVLIHIDAVQALGKMKLNLADFDLASFSAHKIHGPKGVGALYIKKGTKIENLLEGGAQENRKRPGTENVAGIVGFAKALEISYNKMAENITKMNKLRNRLVQGITGNIDDVLYNGDLENGLCNNVSLSFKYIEGEAILLMLDREGIAASSGSACASKSLEPSHVLLAIGKKHEDAHGTIRFTLSSETTEDEIDEVIKVMPEIIARLRKMSPLGKEV